MFPSMLAFYQFLKQQNINLIYCGPVWAEGIESVGDMLKKRMEIDQMPMSSSMAVFSVFVEQMNNVQLYSAEHQQDTSSDLESTPLHSGVFILGTVEHSYYLQTGNVMKNEHVDLIRNRVDHLNTLDKAELRKFYKERLRADDDNPESKGAGLGLIEIARRASSKIEYNFEPFDSTHSFFTMYVTIG